MMKDEVGEEVPGRSGASFPGEQALEAAAVMAGGVFCGG
jgi:hypothetical protein